MHNKYHQIFNLLGEYEEEKKLDSALDMSIEDLKKEGGVLEMLIRRLEKEKEILEISKSSMKI